jgi:hypothetical protein
MALLYRNQVSAIAEFMPPIGNACTPILVAGIAFAIQGIVIAGGLTAVIKSNPKIQ